MKIKMKYNFTNALPSLENKEKHLNDLNKEELLLLIDFFKDIINNSPLYGKNKSSAKLPPIKEHNKLRNYAIFFNNEFYHYHLGKDFTENKDIKYTCNNKDSLKSKSIKDLDSENFGEFKTSNTLVNYQIINDVFIIYNITKHNEWTLVINDLLNQGIDSSYTTCNKCNQLINNNNKCNCSETTTTTIGAKDRIVFGDYAGAIVNSANEIKYNEQKIICNLLPYDNPENDIILETINDINNFFKFYV